MLGAIARDSNFFRLSQVYRLTEDAFVCKTSFLHGHCFV